MTLAVGDVVCASNVKRAVCLMYETAVNVNPPTLSTDGVVAYSDPRRIANLAGDTGAFYSVEAPRTSTLVVSGYIKAVLAIDGPANATWNTIIRAVQQGVGQEVITLATANDGTGTGSFTVSGTDITFHFATGVTTAANFEAAIAANATVAALIEVMTVCTTPTYALLTAGDVFGATALNHTSAVIVGTVTLWGYLVATGLWYPILVNSGSALAETTADLVSYSQEYTQLGCFDRLALSLASIGGSGSLFSAMLITARRGY